MSFDSYKLFLRTTSCAAGLGLLLGFAACGSSPSGSTTPGTGSSNAGNHSGEGSSGSGNGSGSSLTGSGEAPQTSGGIGNADGDAASAGGSPGDEAGPMNMQAGGDAAVADGATMPPPHADLGKGDGSDVVMIGDSYMSNTLQFEGTGGGIVPSLDAVSMQSYRNYAVQGTMLLMADTYGPAIPSQWTQAKTANSNVKTVVMTGGGNDIIQGPQSLQTDCQQGGSMCKMMLQQISDAFNTLWTQMASDGVQDIVLIGYTDNSGKVDPTLVHSAPTPAICSTGKVRCWNYDTTPDVAKSDLAADGIHPLKAANDRIATHVYALMTQEGMRR
jgi:hypothetical protein